jgi:hypothetical protein
VPGEKKQMRVDAVKKKVGNYISILTKHVARGNYRDGLEPEYVKVLGRTNKYWDMMGPVEKESYLRMMNYIIKDKNQDFHIGDDGFQNVLIGNVPAFVNLGGKLLSKYYLNDERFNYPQKLQGRIYTDTSSFQYGQLLPAVAKYTRDPNNPESRIARYDFTCKCGEKYAYGETKCPLGHTVEPKGNPKMLPVNKEAWTHTYKQMDQWAKGMLDDLAGLPAEEQEEEILAGMQKQVNCGWPFYMKQTTKNLKNILWKFCDLVGFKVPNGWPQDKLGRTLITVDAVLEIYRWADSQGLYFPYVVFYRIQPGDGEQKHRPVFGAHVLAKYLAGVFSAAYGFGYQHVIPGSQLDPVFADKPLFGVGGLPIVAQADWRPMFDAIVRRLPQWDSNTESVVPMDDKLISELFHKKLPPGEYKVNVIGDDFSRFDTSQIYEDYLPLVKHRRLGWLMRIILDELRYSEVWTANMAISDVFFKSGFFGTSNFGSAFHRNFAYNCAEEVGGQILALTVLSDDDIGFVIDMTSHDMQKYGEKYGLVVKSSDSYDFIECPIVFFLKVGVGRVLTTNENTYIGDVQTKYYGLLHSERDVDEDERFVDPLKDPPNIKGVYRVTNEIDVDRLLSKLASFGAPGLPFARQVLEAIKNEDLGRKAILAISTLDSTATYEMYRDDVLINFSVVVLSDLEIQDLLPGFNSLV